MKIWDTVLVTKCTTRFIKCHSKVTTNPASRSGDNKLQFLSRDKLYGVSLWFPSAPPGKCQDRFFKLIHDHFPPYPFQFIIHWSAYQLKMYSFSSWQHCQTDHNYEIHNKFCLGNYLKTFRLHMDICQWHGIWHSHCCSHIILDYPVHHPYLRRLERGHQVHNCWCVKTCFYYNYTQKEFPYEHISTYNMRVNG
jgi:hypothetical protein